MYANGISLYLTNRAILAKANAGTPPVNTIAPIISGSTSLGSTLTSTTGTWTGTPVITYAYQWKRNGSNIIGATSNSYTLVVADSAANITCQVTATNAFGSANATSNTITAQTYSAPINTVAPALSGTAQDGQTMTCSQGLWTGNPTPTYAYQWKRNGSNIIGATSSSYLLVTADVGQSIKCTVTATNAVGSTNSDSNTVTPIAAVDADAQAFITAASITNPTQQSAINTLVVDLKGYGVWTKMKALYPFVGGTASSHKFNLKNPLDTDAAFRLVFNGGWTHSSTGATPNGTNAYADTYLTNNLLGQNNNHISAYSRTNNTILSTLISSWNSTFGVAIYPLSSGFIYGYNNASPSVTVSNTDSRGFFLNSRSNNSQILLQKNTNQNTINNGSATYITSTFKIGKTGEYNGEWGSREIAFSSIGDGLTNTEASNLYTAVQAFQTTLSRQV